MIKKYSGRGVFLFPSATISKLGDQELGKCIRNQRIIELDLTLSETIRILVTEDGFLAPITNLPSDKNERLLNVIISTLTTKFTPSRLPSWKSDWVEFQYDDGGEYIELGYARGGFSIRNQMEFERDGDDTYYLWKDMPRIPIMTLALKRYIEQAFRFYNNPEYADDLLLIGESWSLSFEDMENASFLYSWMIIEYMIEKTWKKFLGTLTRSKSEKDFLKNNNSWYTSHRIQALSFANKLNDDTRNSLNKLRKMRNDIIHNRHQVTKEESLDCLSLATDLIYDKLNYGDNYLMQSTKLLSEQKSSTD